MGWGSSETGWGPGDHWLHVWEEAGLGLSFFCLPFDLFASRLFWFSTWRNLGTLSKVQTPVIFPTGSSRALGCCKALAHRELDCRAAVTNPACSVHKFGHFVSLLYWTTWVFASQKFPRKTRNLGLHFVLVLPPRQKTWGKLLRWFLLKAFPFFLLQQNFISKFVCS